MAAHLCTRLACRMPLHHVYKWGPFHIDALGIVTMIGAEQVDRAIGRLVSSCYTDYLPLLGAFVIASNGFTDAIPGFTTYNLTDGITTTDMAGWFARWCLKQDFPRGGTTVTWTTDEDWDEDLQRKYKIRSRFDTWLALTIGICINGFLVAFTILQGDWWGLANAASMIISVAVRWFVVKKNRDTIDSAVTEALHPTPKPEDSTAMADNDPSSEPDLPVDLNSPAKCFITFNDAKQINMIAPVGLVRPIFIDKPKVTQHRRYLLARIAGWIGFAAHVITIGMSGLATQIVTVFIMVVPTVMTVYKVGCNDHLIGSKLHAKIEKSDSERRLHAFIHLDLSKEEEVHLNQWNLTPRPGNVKWWLLYDKEKAKWEKAKLDKTQPTPPSAANPPLQVSMQQAASPNTNIQMRNLAPQGSQVTGRASSFSGSGTTN